MATKQPHRGHDCGSILYREQRQRMRTAHSSARNLTSRWCTCAAAKHTLNGGCWGGVIKELVGGSVSHDKATFSIVRVLLDCHCFPLWFLSVGSYVCPLPRSRFHVACLLRVRLVSLPSAEQLHCGVDNRSRVSLVSASLQLCLASTPFIGYQLIAYQFFMLSVYHRFCRP